MDNHSSAAALGASPTLLRRATETADFLRKSLPSTLQTPRVAIVCGTGLGGLADTVEPEPRVELDYGDVPGFPGVTGERTQLK